VTLLVEDASLIPSPQDHADPAELVFPKVAMCMWKKHGASGEVRRIDTICALPLNILNEKIFYILWCWYIVLFAFSVLGAFFRLSTIIFRVMRA